MNGAKATIVTTPFPMHGYEEDVLGGDFVFSRLNDVYGALPPRMRMSHQERPHAGAPASSRQFGRHFYVKALQTAAIDWYSLARIEAVMSTGDAPDPECADSDY